MFRFLPLVLFSMIVLITITLLTQTHNYLNQTPSERRAKIAAPDFVSFTSAKDKKNAFFDYLRPMVKTSNSTILKGRARLDKITQTLKEGTLKKTDAKFLDQLAHEYGLEDENISNKQKNELLKLRVDQVPESLALAQAAKESGWGTSRFARDANNYFGQWCYTQGCGLVPKQQPKGATHEVRKFAHTADSVDAYLKNINTHNAYKELREIRAELRQQDQVSGLMLTKGLSSYSQRGEAYIKEIQSMIQFNKLDELDQSID